MKTVFTLAIGLWLGRQIYVTYDRQQALEKEKVVKKRLLQFLKENGITANPTDSKINKILNVESIND